MDRLPIETGRIYYWTQSISTGQLAAAAAIEVFTLLASTLSRVDILKLELAQQTSAAVSGLIEHWRGSTGGSTGTAVASVSQEGYAAAPAAVSVITGVSTTLNSTSTASQNVVRTEANAFEMDSGKYKFEPVFPPSVDYLQRYSVRLTPSTAPSGPIVATLTFRETGRAQV
jgi:hypothetical protein